jgi:hypothetical protein
VFAGGSFTKINGVAQKSLVKLRLSDGARITACKGKTNARVKDMAVSGGRLYTDHADGAMTVREFDGATAGFTTPVALNGLTSTQFPISRITGMFF